MNRTAQNATTRVPVGAGNGMLVPRVESSAAPTSSTSASTTRRGLNPTMPEPIDYKSAGVDLDTYEETMAQLPPY